MIEQNIFKSRSNTFYAAAQFFPPEIRGDVTALYGFLRVADDYVDTQPSRVDKLNTFYQAWSQEEPNIILNKTARDILNKFIDLEAKYGFERSWTEAFFSSMFSDVKGQTFHTLPDSLSYVYGSGEIVGLMMARIMGCPLKADRYAKLLGRAFQWINFVRDIDEDSRLGRCYFPGTDLKKFGLKDLTKPTTETNLLNFTKFINFQLARYRAWQKQAETGFLYIPRPARLAVETAAIKYQKTAQVIADDPISVFKTDIQQPMQSAQASLHR